MPAAGELQLSGDGASRYKEFEVTTRHLGGERKDITVSYVWSRGLADLNHYDQFFGNQRTPLVRANEYGPIATDVRHRLMVRGTLGLPGSWSMAPVLELRPGFPWSAVDEFQDFVGPRNRSGRLPMVQLARPGAGAAVAFPQVPLPRRHAGLQPVWTVGASRRPEQPDVARLRRGVQPD